MAKKDNQKKFLIAYEKNFGNITKSCRESGIDRGTYYSWLRSNLPNDVAFRKKLAEIEPEERFIDFAEHALQKKISKGDTTAIIFVLKTKGKKRGYNENLEIQHSGIIQTEVIMPKIDDDDNKK